MNCETAQEQMLLLAYEELGDAEAAELELHLRICSACQTEMEQLRAFHEVLSAYEPLEPSANFLAESRVRLDAALDEAGIGSWTDRLRAALLGTWSHVAAAPALATLLIGAGFLGGNLITRYQIARTPKLPAAITVSNQTQGIIGNISGIDQTPNSEIVQVRYNRIIPETMQGSLDDPQVRQLLLIGAKNGISNDVRENSVQLLAAECRASHHCDAATGEGSTGVRDALLVSLRYDKSANVRLKALEGLSPYVGADQRVRDAVLESLMRDDSAAVRTRAVSMLQPVNADTTVREALHSVSTTDASPYIRNASTHALEGMDGLQ